MTQTELLWAFYFAVAVAAILGLTAMYWRERYKQVHDYSRWAKRQNDYLRHLIKNMDLVLIQKAKEQFEWEDSLNDPV